MKHIPPIILLAKKKKKLKMLRFKHTNCKTNTGEQGGNNDIYFYNEMKTQ